MGHVSVNMRCKSYASILLGGHMGDEQFKSYIEWCGVCICSLCKFCEIWIKVCFVYCPWREVTNTPLGGQLAAL